MQRPSVRSWYLKLVFFQISLASNIAHWKQMMKSDETDENKEINHTFIFINITKKTFWIADPLSCTTKKEINVLRGCPFQAVTLQILFFCKNRR